MTGTAVDWQRVRAVVFDVDGTLYGQQAMRLRMVREMALRCLVRPTTLSEARILRAFRQLREELADEGASGIAQLQYDRTAERLRVPASRVEAVVEEWILQRPLRHVGACRQTGVRRLFAALRRKGRRIGVWSDYPAVAKLESMGLSADAVVAATDPEVDRMKPHPAGLSRVLEILATQPAEALMVGDRDERDGEAARRLGCPYLLLAARPAQAHEFAGHTDLLSSLAASPD